MPPALPFGKMHSTALPKPYLALDNSLVTEGTLKNLANVVLPKEALLPRLALETTVMFGNSRPTQASTTT